MDALALSLVLLAAVLHASWNALVKTGADPFVRLAILNLFCGAAALPMLLASAPPAPASWPYLLGSVAIHHVYYLALAAGYRYGDLSHVYPIARGIAPPLVALCAWLWAGEPQTAGSLLAILLISLAITSLAFGEGWRLGPLRPLGFALLTGASIAAYTLCDGLGGRLAGDVGGYIAWLFVLDTVPLTVMVALWKPAALRAQLRTDWKLVSAGGVLAFVAYALVIWAMTIAPMAQVSALRETSVILAALIGTRLLGEPFGRRRVVAASLVALGVILLETAGAA
jgi:drug/metabolite transporter (DMT)-like permease